MDEANRNHSFTLPRPAPADPAAVRLALLRRGDRGARLTTTPQNSRLSRVFEALAALGVHAEPAIYDEDMAEEVREQLFNVDGVLVWVDPISQGRDRRELDALLRDLASRGVWVSAHPDVILKMGVKEALHRTKDLGWGTDTHLYRTADAFRDTFPRNLAAAGPRVIKRNRGNGGIGSAISGAAHPDGSRMDPADDAAARARHRLPADHLGRRFSLRVAHGLR
jgi:hypothetical protein